MHDGDRVEGPARGLSPLERARHRNRAEDVPMVKQGG